MTERGTVDKLLSDLTWIHDSPTSPTDHVPEPILRALGEAAEKLEKQLEQTPRDERLWQEYGLLALKRDDLTTAEQCFARCLRLATKPHTLASIQLTRDSAIYNEACVFARAHRYDACRQNLEDLHRRGVLNCEWARVDTDLENVWSCPWFSTLCGS
jgi:tetratricopeptide (TPR) repeat protein